MKELASTMLVTPANADNFVSQLSSLFGPMERDVHEVSLTAEGPLLSGRLEVQSLRPGFRLFSMNMDVQQDLEVDIEPPNDGVFFSLVLDGSSGYSVQRPAASHSDLWEFVPGRNIVGTFQPDRARWTVSGGDSHRLVELHIASGRALQLSEEYLNSTPGQLHPMLAQTNDFPMHVRKPLSPELRIVAHQILNCPLQGLSRRLFMESKALEILALQLESLSSSSAPGAAIRSKMERDRLEEARRILDREFAEPPSLLTLARRVGLNDFKLKSGFRDLYQTTVFGYVRMLRMERARAMLEAGDRSVSEVALAIGYSCFGHFAKAFRKHFGVTPRDFRNRQ